MYTVRLSDGSSRQVTAFRQIDRVQYLVDENGNAFLPTVTNPSGPYSDVEIRGADGSDLAAPEVKP